MKYFKDSFFFNLINKLDLKENSLVFQSLKTSFFLKLLNNFFVFIQNLCSKITAKSRSKSIILEKIDSIILFLITLLLLSLTFASTKVIGILAGLCFLAFIIKLCLKKDEKLCLNVLDAPIFLYILIIGLSVAFSSLFIPALKGYLKVIIYFCSYLTFFNVLKNNPKKSYYILGVIAFSACAESLTAVYQNFTGVEALATWQDKSCLNPEQIMTRVYGTLQPLNPNLLAGYLIASISSTAALFFVFALKRKFKLSVLFLFMFFSILAAIVFTGSRGAYLALCAVLTGIVLSSGHIIWNDFKEKIWLKKLWLFIILAGIIAVLVLILSSPALQHRIMSIFAFREDSSNSFRFNVYIASTKMFFDNWFIGIGPGNEVFRLMYGLYMKTGFNALGAYCVPLEIAVESGIFALLAFLWLNFMIFVKGIKIVLIKKFKQNIEQKIIILACIIGITGIMVHGFVDTIFFRPQIQLIFWMFVAIFGANSNDTDLQSIK